jgi:hypothetical protein
MPAHISLHPADGADKTRLEFFCDDTPTRGNANGLRVIFQSPAPFGHHRTAEITMFGLDNDTAHALSMLGKLKAPMRAKLVPILQHMLDEQTAEAAVEAEAEA